MPSLGSRLRQQRLAAGVELSEIATETRISVRYLEALENEDWKVLPGAIFARSFARQYASFVGIDPAEIEADVQALFHNEGEPPVAETAVAHSGIQLEPIPEAVGVPGRRNARLLRGVFTLAGALVACSAVYVGWQSLSRSQMGGEVEQRLPEPLASQPSPAALPEAVTETDPESGEMSVRLVASQKTWVSIEANGKSVFSGILQPNESRTFTVGDSAKMIVGNAGGLDVQANGKSIGPIGPPGQVRIVLLSPEGTQILRRPKPAGDDGEGSSSNGSVT